MILCKLIQIQQNPNIPTALYHLTTFLLKYILRDLIFGSIKTTGYDDCYHNIYYLLGYILGLEIINKWNTSSLIFMWEHCNN